MKSIVYCSDNSVKWVRENFSQCSPYLLEIGNKPFLEYLIDFCVLAKIRQIRIVQDEHDQRIQQHLGDGSRWDVELSYTTAKQGSHANAIEQYNSGFIGNDTILLFNGMFWLSYDKHISYSFSTIGSLNFQAMTPAGDGWRFIAAEEHSHSDRRYEEKLEAGFPQVSPLNSILDFYQKSMTLLNGESEHYNLPGYGADKTILIGRNVVIPRSAKIISPAIIGDCVQLGQDTEIGPNAVVGSNSFIDDNSTINNSVVISHSYLGCNLELNCKIAAQNMVIDPNTGTRLDIADEFLLTHTINKRKNPCILCSLRQRIVAFLLWIVWLLPWLMIRPWCRLKSKDIFINSGTDKLQIRLYTLPGKNLFARWFFKLSLDRFHLLRAVIYGKLRLVGNIILDDESIIANELEAAFKEYTPGIFSYSEALGHGNDYAQCRIDELYYLHHAKFSFNLWILYKTLIRNFLKET